MYKNTVSNISNTGASGIVQGLYLYNNGTMTVHNNRIVNLTAPNYDNTAATATTSAVNGITVAGGSTLNLYHNTVHLSGTASGANFGSSALNITSTSTTVTAKNNIFHNETTPTGAGLAVAHRRAGTTISSYAAGSNRNLFYAGAPSNKKLIYFDGTNRDSTLAQYQVRMATRELNSFTENITPRFISTTYGNPGFLKFATGATTRCEGGGEVVSGVTTDFEGDIRQGNTGYIGTGNAPDVGADEFEGIPAQQIIISAAPILCNGGTAQVTVTVVGGTAPYQGIGTFTRSAGTYTFTVTDASGYATSKTITIQQPTVLIATASATTIFCNGGTATVTINASGGTAPYTGIGNLNVIAGTYTYMVTDANGCTANTTITLTQPAALSVSLTATGILCTGSSMVINATMQGGASPYQYYWSNGNSGSANLVYTANIYTVTATDQIGCSATKTISVSALPAPLATITGNTPICQGFSTMVTASGGVSYSWSNSLTDADIWISSGTYSVTVTGSNGCTATASTAISTLPPMVFTFNTTSDCDNNHNGAIALSIAGSAAPFTYIWNTGAATNTISNLTAGTYRVTVTDNNGCMKIGTKTVTAATAPNPTITSISTACGSLTLTADGGSAYAWSNGQNTPENTVTTDGVYTVTVTNSNGCTASTQIRATVSLPTVTITGPTTICPNISITLTVTGGGTYNWGGGITTDVRTVSAVGVYTVTVTDTNGCTATASYIVTAATNCCTFAVTDMRFTLYSTYRTLAFNTPTTSGATAGSTISYAWNFGDGTTATTANPTKTYSTAGVYTVCLTATATAPNGQICAYNCCRTVNIADPCASTNAAFSYTYNSTNGAFVFAGIPNPGFNSVYTITDANGVVVATSPVVVSINTASTHNYNYTANLPVGTYNVCRSLTRTMNATHGVYCDVKFCRSIVITQSTCAAAARFTALTRTATPLVVAFNSTSSTNATTQEWSFATAVNGVFTTFATNTNPSYTFANYGTYWVKLIINKGTNCEYTVIHRIEISQPDCVALAGTFSITDMRFTLYSNYRILAFNTPTTAGATAGSTLTYAWDFGDGTTATTANPTKTYSTAGIYTVCLTATATAANGQISTYRCCRTVNIADPSASTNAAFSYTYNSANGAFVFAGIPNPGFNSVYTITNASNGAVVATSPPVVALNTTSTHNYTYTAALPVGTYNVCRSLTRTMNGTYGVYCEVKFCRSIVITQSTCAAAARFTALTRTATPFVVAFNSASSTNATTQEWSFATTANGAFTTFATSTNPSYTFANYGTYWVKLIINKGTSCEYTVIHRIDISQPGCAIFTNPVARIVGNEENEPTSETTLVHDFEHKNEPTIQPNPTDGVVNITLNRLSEEEVTINVVNLQGIILDTQKTTYGTTNLDIDLSKYPSGLYLITMLTASGERVTQKVVKE